MNECMRCRKRKISLIKIIFIGVDKVMAKIDSVEMENILSQKCIIGFIKLVRNKKRIF